MVCIIDYGLGNIGSLVNMCRYIGIETIVGNDEATIRRATHLILPGVGTFDKAISNLKSQDLFELVNLAVLEGNKPILGLCLGAQIMLAKSEEGLLDGFGWVQGQVVRFNLPKPLKIPHMGWNMARQANGESLFDDMPDSEPRFYFVHSYHFANIPEENIACTTNYGGEFVSGFRKGKIVGMQFHPEKSHQFGIKLLENFYKIK
jgi:glutamine amidotransferase